MTNASDFHQTDERPVDADFVHGLREQVERDLCEVFAPELAAAGAERFYVSLATDHGVSLGALGIAFVQPSDSRSWLIGDRYSGPGPLVFVDDVQIRRERRRRDDFASDLLAVAAHEAGHVAVLDFADFRRSLVRPDQSRPETMRETAVASITEHIRGIDQQCLEMTHDASWLRMTLHVVARLQKLGHYVSASMLWPECLNISPPSTYRETLAAELTLTNPIHAIRQRAPPVEFSKLFRADDWRRNEERRIDKCYQQLLSTSHSEGQTMFGIFDRLKQKQAAEKAVAESSLLGLARQIADGIDLDDADVECVLQQTGRMLSDLEAATAAIVQRRGWAQQMAAAEQAEAEAERLREQLQAEEQAFSAVWKQHTDRQAAINARIAQLQVVRATGKAAHRSLTSTAGKLDPHPVNAIVTPHKQTQGERQRHLDAMASQYERVFDLFGRREGQYIRASREGKASDEWKATIEAERAEVEKLENELKILRQQNAEALDIEGRELASRLADVELV